MSHINIHITSYTCASLHSCTSRDTNQLYGRHASYLMILISHIGLSGLTIGYFIVVIMYTIFHINPNTDNVVIIVIIVPGM